MSPDSPNARVVAQAFVALGGYHLAGIPNTRVKRDPTRATEMFHYAAAYFDDADAQYHLGRIFSEGVAGPRDLHQAARWFNLAAERAMCRRRPASGRCSSTAMACPGRVRAG